MIVIAIAILALFLLKNSKVGSSDTVYKKTQFFAISSIFALIPFFRSIEKTKVDDLINYKNMYWKLQFESYESLWNDYLNEDLKDFGFSAFSKIFSDMGFSVKSWMNIIGVIFALAFAFIICKYSKNILNSSLLLLAFFFSFTLTGLRQTVALAFVMISYKFIIDKKLSKFLITVFLASCFHSTAVLFLPAYFLSRLKIGVKQFVLIGTSLVLATSFPSVFRSFVSFFSWNEQIEGYAERSYGLTWSGFIINLLLYILCYVFLNLSDKSIIDGEQLREEANNIFMNCMSIGLIFLAMSTVVAEAFRISYYYNICLCVVVANITEDNSNASNRNILRIAIPSVLILYIIINQVYSGLIFI